MKYVALCDIDFKLAGKTYVVKAGEVVDVPDKFDYAIAGMGLLVKPYVAPPAPTPVVVNKPVPSPAPVVSKKVAPSKE